MSIGKALVAAAAVIALGLLPASAWATTYPTQVTIKGPNGDFSGKVKSDSHDCEKNRKVKVLKVVTGKDAKVGSDTTDSNGSWSTGNSGATNGKFYAVAPKATSGVCERGKSETIKL
jgi:hypothetical protein